MMKHNVLFALMFCCIGLAFGDDDHGEGAIDFTKEKFATDIAKKPHFVMFFAPWCGHCKKLAPVWRDLSTKYNEKFADEQDVLIGKVDCTVESELCSEQEVRGYPTLKFYKSGPDSAVAHKGQRDLHSLVKFINQQMGYEQPEEEEAIVEPEVPVVDNGLHVLTAKSFSKHVQTGKHFVKFYAPWCGHCKNLAPTWAELAKELDGKSDVKVGKLDCTKAQDVCKEAGVRGYPTLKFYKDGKVVEDYKGGRTLGDLKDYIKIMANEGGKAEAEPEKESKVVVLTKETYADAIKSGLVFVKYYAPWCGHCKRLAPIWEDLAEKAEGVSVAKFDCTDGNNKELCNEEKISGFPTLKLYKDGKFVEEYEGKRNVDDMTSFLAKHKAGKDEL